MYLSRLLLAQPKFRPFTAEKLSKSKAARDINKVAFKWAGGWLVAGVAYCLFVSKTWDIQYDRRFGDDPTGFGTEQRVYEKQVDTVERMRKSEREFHQYGDDQQFYVKQ